jgi:hypothetical protein
MIITKKNQNNMRDWTNFAGVQWENSRGFREIYSTDSEEIGFNRPILIGVSRVRLKLELPSLDRSMDFLPPSGRIRVFA